MPRDYGKVNHRFWSGDTGKAMRSMPLEVRVVAGYLMTCGSSNMIGLYYLPLVVMVYEIGSGMTIEGALKALRSLEGLGFAYYDDTNETVFVPTMARRQIGDSLKVADKQRLGVIALLQEHKKSKYYNEFLRLYRDAYLLGEMPFNSENDKAHGRPMEGPSKSESSDQEQEQQQDPPIAPQGGPVNNLLSLTSPERKSVRRRAMVATEGFLKFWAAYPRKTAKGQALKAWPGDELTDRILAALSWQVPTWREVQFMKHPATWLNARCWEDEKPQPIEVGGRY